MQITPILSKSNIVYRENSVNKDRYKKIAEKRAYLDAKTGTLEDLSLLSFIGAVLSGAYDIKSGLKDKQFSKLSVGLILASAALLVTKWIRQMQLSKEYDRGVKEDDSKNFTGN